MNNNRIPIHEDADNGLLLVKTDTDFLLEVHDTSDGTLYWSYSLNQWDMRNTYTEGETQVFPWLLYIASTMITPRLTKVNYDFATDVYHLLYDQE